MSPTMRSHIQISFGKSVRKLRQKRKLSQEKLAELCGLHTNYIGGIERGQQNISLQNIEKIAYSISREPHKEANGGLCSHCMICRFDIETHLSEWL